MGIRFRCNTCDKKLNVKAFLGGKRGICPHCGAKIAIPPAEGAPPIAAGVKSQQSGGSGGTTATAQAVRTESVERPAPQSSAAVASAAPQPVSQPAPVPQLQPQPALSDPLAEAGGAVWYVRPPSGGQYGPASAEYMRRWIEEGRISGDSLVWREGWSDWQSATSALSGLLGGSAPAVSTPNVETPAPALGASLGTEIGASDSSLSKRTGARRRKRSNTQAVIWAVVLLLLVVGLMAALFVVLANQ